MIVGARDIGNGILGLTVDASPLSIGVDCPRGSIVTYGSAWYRKLDDGPSTSFEPFFADDGFSGFSGFGSFGYSGWSESGYSGWSESGYSGFNATVAPAGPAGGVLTGSYPFPTLAPNSVGPEHLALGCVTADKMQVQSIPGSAFGTSCIESANIEGGAVNESKILYGCITEAKIRNNHIESFHFDAFSVPPDRVPANAINNAKLAVDTFRSSSWPDNVVTRDKLALKCVQFNSIIPREISSEKIRNKGLDKFIIIRDLENNKIADGSLSHSGKRTLGDIRITEKIADGAFTQNKIADEILIDRCFADDAFTSSKIDDYALHSKHIINGTILAEKFMLGTINTNHIANQALDGAKIPINHIETNNIIDLGMDHFSFQQNTIPASCFDGVDVTYKTWMGFMGVDYQVEFLNGVLISVTEI